MGSLSALWMLKAKFPLGNTEIQKTQGWRSRLVITHSWGEFTVTTMKVKAEEGKVSPLRTTTKWQSTH